MIRDQEILRSTQDNRISLDLRNHGQRIEYFMFIKSLRIKNFRSFRDSKDIPFEQFTTFLGPNGSGKSNILKAIRIFYDVSASVTEQDFHNKKTEEPISVAVTFDLLNAEELKYFQTFLQDGALCVEKRFTYTEGNTNGAYFGKSRRHVPFQEIRNKAGRKKTDAYRQFCQSMRSNDLYSSLPSARSVDAVDQALAQWESTHLSHLEWMQSPVQFFGPPNIGGGSLDNFTRFVPVPAIREASTEAADSRGSAFAVLLSVLLKEVIFQREDFLEFKRKATEKYQRLMNPMKFQGIPELERSLTDRLQTLVPESAVHLNLGEIREPSFNLPEMTIELTEDNFRGAVEGKGHGLQRAFIISILQELAVVQAQRDEQIRRQQALAENAEAPGDRVARDFSPHLILAIEEPELFQHPVRQRHFANVLRSFTRPTEGQHIQVIITTHSPYFLSINYFNEIRVVMKSEAMPTLAESRVVIGSPENACKTYCDSRGITDPNISTFLDGLQNIIGLAVSEAFFARCVVVVEGPDDRAAIAAALRQRGFDATGSGIPIIEAGGKSNLSRIRTVLASLGIDSFLSFDCDGHATRTDQLNKHEKDNLSLFYLCKGPSRRVEAFPKKPVVQRSFACFPNELEETLREELGAFNFLQKRDKMADEKSLNRKNPVIYQKVLADAYAEGYKSITLDKIVSAVQRLAKAQLTTGRRGGR